MKTLPVCYFPTTVVFIDDQWSFFHTVEMKLDPEGGDYKFYESAEEALHYLQHVYQPDAFTKRCIFRLEEKEFDHRNIEVKIPLIHQEIYQSQRFQQISTIVVDYDMPSLNGLEVCKQINLPFVQKILLTGAGSESLAVQAFNDGLIHGYLRKQDDQMYEKLQQILTNAQQRYFIELSHSVLQSVCLNAHKIHALNDPVFIAAFQQFCQEYNIKEYYLLDDQGSFMAIDSNDKMHGFFTYDEKKQEGLEQIVVESEDIPENVVKMVQQKSHILCHYSREGEDFPEEGQWEKALYSARVLQGISQKYTIAITPDIFGINR